MLKVYDPILGQIRPFQFEKNASISMYVCGVTPYDVGHLGHALTYVFFDTVKRYLEFCGYEIHHIQNITDIDDGMIKKSKEKNISIAELTEINHNLYLSEMDSLNVLRPKYLILNFTDESYCLIHLGMSGTIHLIKKNTQSLRQLERTDTMPEEPEHLKRDTLDFLLWQPETFEEASFDSPWSSGRPGWHIECSTMVNEIIGEQVTIHGGGYDLIFPHHECEAAQSQSVTGVEPYCKNWMHVSALNINGKKMSKSLGNLIRVSELLEKGFSSNTIRMYLLSHHYRSGIEFNEDILHSFSLKNDLLIKAVSEVGGPADQLAVQPLRNSFMDAMDEDFDTSSALEIIFEIADQIVAGKLENKTAIPTLIELSNVLGITI